MSENPIDIRVRGLEHRVKELEQEMKELTKTVNDQQVTLAEIKLTVKGLEVSWTKFEQDIKATITQALTSHATATASTTTSFKEITVEAIKAVVYIAGAVIAAKSFLGK